MNILIGTAGWSIPRRSADRCPGDGTHLERYARVFPCAEINSSFHRPHAAAVYQKWAAATPSGFKFAVKVPRTITHEQKLRRARRPLDQFLSQIAGLEGKLGPLLVQLPPSLSFDARSAGRFFDLLRARHEGAVVCEPRHPTWFSTQAAALLGRQHVARVAADPPPAEGALTPGGWPGLVYYRLHGAPRTYWSKYDETHIARMSDWLRAHSGEGETWCVFDNTASGAALENAWELMAHVRRGPDTTQQVAADVC